MRGAVPALVEDVLLEPLFRESRRLVASGKVAAIARHIAGDARSTG
jgi:hypothetical protein